MNNSPLLRSVLYLPAINQRAIEKAPSINADAIVFDLEDSVAPDAKDQARKNLLEAFSKSQFGESFSVIRTNAIDSADYLKDLDVIARCNPDAVLLPKVSDVADVELFEQDAIKNGFRESLQAWYMIETVAGLMNLQAIVDQGKKCRYTLQSLVVGHNDLAREAGVSYGHNRVFFMPWLMQVILCARHNNVAVLDSVWNHFKDLEGFRAETLQASGMGFDGKTLIHPSQVDITNEIFTPGPSQIADARQIITAFLQPENANAGVINLNGRMVERLHLQQAYDLLNKHGINN